LLELAISIIDIKGSISHIGNTKVKTKKTKEKRRRRIRKENKEKRSF
jgi:hypothetical protein